MRSDIEDYTNKELFFFLTSSFFIFYLIQIPFFTSFSDILVYSCRSLSDSPIIKYAFLDERSRFGNPPIPNYHLAHTIVLWIAYHIFPDGLSHTIWPSGFVTALSGAFIVGLTFLIWSELGLPRLTTFIFYLIKRCSIAWKQHKNLLIFLLIGIAPQFILVFIDPQFLAYLGCFLLLIFWALCFHIGLAITKLKQKRASIYICFVGTALISLMFWGLPDKEAAVAINEAGLRIRSEISEDMKIIGHWGRSIGITLAVYGRDIEKLSSSYLEKKNPTTSDLLNTGEESLIIVKSKKDKLRA